MWRPARELRAQLPRPGQTPLGSRSFVLRANRPGSLQHFLFFGCGLLKHRELAASSKILVMSPACDIHGILFGSHLLR